VKSPHVYNRVYYVNEDEVLSGYVNGDPCSDIEERAFRALAKRQIPAAFRFRINPLLGFTQTRMNILGELEVDFLAQYRGEYVPLLIDGEISHFMAMWQIDSDVEKVIEINRAMSVFKARPAIRIPFWKLKDQRVSDQTISEIFDMIIPVAAPQKPNDIRSRVDEKWKEREKSIQKKRQEAIRNG
jgi:hypothetical protein